MASPLLSSRGSRCQGLLPAPWAARCACSGPSSVQTASKQLEEACALLEVPARLEHATALAALGTTSASARRASSRALSPKQPEAWRRTAGDAAAGIDADCRCLSVHER